MYSCLHVHIVSSACIYDTSNIADWTCAKTRPDQVGIIYSYGTTKSFSVVVAAVAVVVVAVVVAVEAVVVVEVKGLSLVGIVVVALPVAFVLHGIFVRLWVYLVGCIIFPVIVG